MTTIEIKLPKDLYEDIAILAEIENLAIEDYIVKVLEDAVAEHSAEIDEYVNSNDDFNNFVSDI